MLNISHGKRILEPEVTRREATSTHQNRSSPSYASATSMVRGQDHHLDNYADNYLRYPRRDFGGGRGRGRGHLYNGGGAVSEGNDGSPARGRGTSPGKGRGRHSSGPSPQLQERLVLYRQVQCIAGESDVYACSLFPILNLLDTLITTTP